MDIADHENIAAAIRSAFYETHCAGDLWAVREEATAALLDCVVGNIGNVLAKENRWFDRARFSQLCGQES